MEYKNLEKEYDKIFEKKVLPFIKKNIPVNFRSLPAYHLLENLKINRFRGSLPIIIAREYNINEDTIFSLSAFCEFTFTTAMAQDDYYDNDNSREGVVSAHKKFGIKQTLVSCDYVNHKLISLLNSSLLKNNFSIDVCNKILNITNNGMALWYSSVLMELNSKKDLFSIDEDYVKTIYLSKTIHGRMLLECLFILMGENEEKIKLIQEYSKHLAIAGQLKNDIYDFTKHKKYRGLSDLREGHITWPLFLLIKSLEENEKKTFLEDLKNKRFENLINLFKKYKIFEKTLELINFHVNEAKFSIKDNFPNNIESFFITWADGNKTFSKKLTYDF